MQPKNNEGAMKNLEICQQKTKILAESTAEKP